MPSINDYFRDPDRGFRVFKRSEVASPTGNGLWVPNPGDLIFDVQQGWFIITEVDYTTGYSEMIPWTQVPSSNDNEEGTDILIAYGPGHHSETFRLFLDTSVTPFVISPDSRLFFPGSMVDSYKVFLGSDINNESGIVISTFVDNSGNFLGTSIPVETSKRLDTEGRQLETIKVPISGSTNARLDDGELVTLVAYGDDGEVVSRAQLLVHNTATARQSSAGKRYIKGISIETSFLSDADAQVIEFPLNVTVDSLPLLGVIHYSNGDRERRVIDNGSFFLHGLENYIATTVGQKYPMTLVYQMADDEISYSETPTANRRLTKTYYAMTTTVDGAYEVKLYMYPRWVDGSNGYRMTYWLYNLNRQVYYDVTNLIELGSTSEAFDPLLYGTRQRITVALDLNKVDNTFAPYRHVQNFEVVLLGPGNESNDGWEVSFTPGQEDDFGRGLVASLEYINTNDWYLRIHQNEPSVESWLRLMYEGIYPLVDARRETYPPTPTHFEVRFNNNTYEYPINQFNQDLLVNNDLEDGDVLTIHWISRTYDTDLQLGVTGLKVIQTID